MAGWIEWDNDDKTILLNIYEGVVKLEDYYHVTDATFTALGELSHPVGVILDRTGVKYSPANVAKVLQYANKRTTDNLCLTVVVGANAFTRAVARLGQMIAPKLTREVYFANSREEARQIIQQKLSETAKTT